MVGLTATPSQATYAFFRQNVVSEYTHEQAKADGVNVGSFGTVRIVTEKTKDGGIIARVNNDHYIRDKRKRTERWQETDGELNKSLQKLTAQNTQAAKDLQEAKDRARDLEKQLEEALKKNKGCSTGCLGMIAAIVSIASVACWLVCLII